MPLSSTSRVRSALLVLLFGAAAVAVAPAPAWAAWPVAPTHLRVAAASASSFTVSADRSANARSYVLYASTVASDVWYANLTAGRHSSALHTARGTSPRLT